MKTVGEVMAIGRTFKEALPEGDALARARDAARPAGDDSRSIAEGTGACRAADRYELIAAGVPARRGARRGASPHRHRRRSSWPSCATSSSSRGEVSGEPVSWPPDLLRRRNATASATERLRRAHRPRRARGTRPAPRARRRPGLQGGRHLRGRVRGRRRRTSTRRTRTRTRPRPATARSVVILGSGPNRIGQGIEFDYCCVHAAMTAREMGFEADHGELQPRDRLDRLRHLGPAVLRAAHLRGRDARRRGERAPRGGHRAVRRPDAAEARGRARRGGRPDPGHAARASIDLAEDRGRFGALLARARRALPRVRPGDDRRRGARRGAPDRLSAARAPSLRPRRPRHGDRLRRRRAGRLHADGGPRRARTTPS